MGRTFTIKQIISILSLIGFTSAIIIPDFAHLSPRGKDPWQIFEMQLVLGVGSSTLPMANTRWER